MKHWAFHCPENYQHKYDLVEAEKARVLGQYEKAAMYYDRAVKGASEHEYIHEAALANELAAEFYLACDRQKQKILTSVLLMIDLTFLGRRGRRGREERDESFRCQRI